MSPAGVAVFAKDSWWRSSGKADKNIHQVN